MKGLHDPRNTPPALPGIPTPPAAAPDSPVKKPCGAGSKSWPRHLLAFSFPASGKEIRRIQSPVFILVSPFEESVAAHPVGASGFHALIPDACLPAQIVRMHVSKPVSRGSPNDDDDCGNQNDERARPEVDTGMAPPESGWADGSQMPHIRPRGRCPARRNNARDLRPRVHWPLHLKSPTAAIPQQLRSGICRVGIPPWRRARRRRCWRAHL